MRGESYRLFSDAFVKLQDEKVITQSVDLQASVRREIVHFGMKLPLAYINEIIFHKKIVFKNTNPVG